MTTTTVLDRLEEAVANDWGKLVFHGDGEPAVFTARELFAMAQTRAGRLRELGIGHGDRVGIVGPNSAEWVAWAYSLMMLGGAYVPLPVPLRLRDPDSVARQLAALASTFGCQRVAAHERYADLVAPASLIRWGDINAAPLEPAAFVHAGPDEIARIIPTSGSAAVPKGVGRSYGSTSAAAMSSLNPYDLDEVPYLTYAPIAHSAGLMGVVAPFESWLTMHMLAPDRFARDPASLFRLVGPHKIMMLPASSSAISAVLRAIERNPEGVDLSSLTRLTLSFEPVDPAVVDRLVEIGGRFGLRPDALAAQYGLTEGGTTRTAPEKGIRIDEVDLDALVTDGVARSPIPGRPTKRLASSGSPYVNALRIVGPEGELPERHVGEAQFRGEHLLDSYLGAGPEENYLDDGWLRTGDVGYVAEGELFITGRSKEMLVQQGRNYHPQDVEWATAEALDIAPDACVAFEHDGEIVVLIEAARVGDGEQRVRAAVMNSVGAVVRTIAYVPADSLPKTASGKPQRLATRDQFASGVIREL